MKNTLNVLFVAGLLLGYNCSASELQIVDVNLEKEVVSSEVDTDNNLALGKPVTAFTNQQVGSPYMIVDGSYQNVWYSYQSRHTEIQFIIDLEQENVVGGFHVKTAQTSNWQIETSVDGVNWTQRHTGTLNYYDQSDQIFDVTATEAYSARYVRYLGSNDEYGYCGVQEIEIYTFSEVYKAKAVVTVPAASGEYYTLQRTADPSMDSWQDVVGQTGISGSDGPVLLSDAPEVGTSWFYRVLKSTVPSATIFLNDK